MIAEISYNEKDIVHIGDNKYRYEFDPESMSQEELIEYEKILEEERNWLREFLFLYILAILSIFCLG